MYYFTIDIVFGDSERTIEVESETSGRALIKVLEHIDSIDSEKVLHSIHVGRAMPFPSNRFDSL